VVLITFLGKDGSFCRRMEPEPAARCSEDAGDDPHRAVRDGTMENAACAQIERAGWMQRPTRAGKPIASAPCPAPRCHRALNFALRHTPHLCRPTTPGRIGLPDHVVGIFPGAGRHNPSDTQNWGDGGRQPFLLEGKIGRSLLREICRL